MTKLLIDIAQVVITAHFVLYEALVLTTWVFVCASHTPGNPRPSVVWWRRGALQDAVSEVATDELTRNSLRLPRLTRSHLLSEFTCLANNNNITAPLSATVTIDIACELKLECW